MDPQVTPARMALTELERARTTLFASRATMNTAGRRAHLARTLKLLIEMRNAHRQSPDLNALVAALVFWVEACPVTSAELATATLNKDDAELLGPDWDGAFYGYLTILVEEWPQVSKSLGTRAGAARARILAGIRRCAVTIRSDADGRIRLRALTDDDTYKGAPLNRLRRTAVRLLLDGGNGAPLTLLRYPVPPHTLPPQIPDRTADITSRGYTTDSTFVPDTEWPAVRFVIAEVAATTRSSDPEHRPIDLRGTVWPMVIPVQTGRVHYELVTDQQGKIRPERLGPAASRPLPGFLTQGESLPTRKASVIQRYGLSGLDDRPYVPGTPGTPAKNWTAEELGRLAALYERMPIHVRNELRGVALVRDAVGDMTAADALHGGTVHVVLDTIDAFGPPSPLPHVHYFDLVFDAGETMCCGSPGDSGAGGDFTILHEFGHVLEMCPRKRLDDVLVPMRQRSVDAERAYRTIVEPHIEGIDALAARRAWLTAIRLVIEAREAFSTAASAYYTAAKSSQAASIQSTRTVYANALRLSAERLALAQPAAEKLDTILPEGVRGAAGIVESIRRTHELIIAVAAAGEVLLHFTTYAAQVSFPRFTDYSRTSDREWFAETIALFGTDRERFWELNWRMFRWIEDGFPRLDDYVPKP